MQTKMNIRPLQGEFWPLEGVSFAEDVNSIVVYCHIYGDTQFKGHVELKWLGSFVTEETKCVEDGALYSVVIRGNPHDINNGFLGFGIMFKKDFEVRDHITVRVEAASKQ